MVLNCCAPSTEAYFSMADWFVDISPALVGIAGLLVSYFVVKMQLNAIKKEREINALAKKLNEFYAPFYQLRQKSRMLYFEFRKKYVATDSSFSTLRYLIDGKEFKGDSKVLLDEIVSIGKECETLIHQKAGLIDHPKIRTEYLPKLSTHYRLITMALEGKFEGDIDALKTYSFPAEIDDVINRRIKTIQARLQELNS